jgi:AraC-like DNA-binding protein
MAPLSLGEANESVRRAHAQFHSAALARLFPEIAGPGRGVALAREQNRGALYLANASQRLSAGFAAAQAHPDAEERRRAVLRRERQFLAQHLAASASRMRVAADLANAGGEGYWLMDFARPHAHCEMCMQRQGRVYPTSWLLGHGPASDDVHPGCLCRVLSVSEARRRGLRIVRAATGDLLESSSPWQPHKRTKHGPQITFERDRPLRQMANTARQTPAVNGPITPEVERAIVKHFTSQPEGSRSVKGTARALGVSPTPVERVLDASGIQRKRNRILSDGEIRAIHAKYAMGDISLINLAKREGCSPSALNKRFRGLGLQIRPTGEVVTRQALSHEDVRRAHIAYWGSGRSLASVASEFGTSPSHLGIRFRKAGLPAKSRGRKLREAQLAEAVIHVPLFGSGRTWDGEKHPRDYHGHFAPVHHDELHPIYRDAMRHVTEALAAGDSDGVERADEELQQRSVDLVARAGDDPKRNREAWKHVDHADRVLSRVIGVSINPEADRAGPTGVHETKGITKPWAGKSFAWSIPDGIMPPSAILNLNRSESFHARRSPDGGVVLNTPGSETGPERGAARLLESIYPRLRQHRIAGLSRVFADDRPLDVGPGERDVEYGKLDAPSIYGGVSTLQLGDAGENLVAGASERARELGLTDEPGFEIPALKAGAPLDLIMGDLATEVKTIPVRGVTPGEMLPSPKISESQRQRKVGEMMARNRVRARDGKAPLRPAQLQVYADPDNDVGHAFLHIYPEGEVPFTSLRLPALAFSRLSGEGIEPGEAFNATSGATDAGTAASDPSRRWVYLGAIRLPINPLHPAFQGRRTDADERRARIGSPTTAAPRFADDGVPMGAAARLAAPPPPPAPPPAPAPDPEKRRDQVVALWHHGRHESGRPLTQGEIAKRVGTTQKTVSKDLAARGVETGGAGKRRDLKPDETRTARILRLDSEGKTVAQIAALVKTNQRYVERVLGRESTSEVAESEASQSDSPDMQLAPVS